MRATATDADVLIVGAGPTGLLLAGDLAGAGVACTVLERRVEDSSLTRAFAVHARTLEELDARGVADELVETGATVGSLAVFGGVRLALSQLETRFPFVLVTPQYHTERLLAERARALGAELVRGAEVTGLRQDTGGVDLEVRTKAAGDGEWVAGTRRASYVVGTDGVRSTVRHALGLPFPGRSIARSLMLADVRLAETPPGVLTANGTGRSFAFIAPFGDGWYRVIAWNRRHQVPDSEPVDFDELRAVTRDALGTDYGMRDPRWTSRFHSDERQAPTYRVGRVFLAGDAAHVHSPAGGLGMNTGLQDAANLGWKLAAAVQGSAPDGLLDSYQRERYPVGTQVLRTSDALLRAAFAQSRALRAVRGVAAALATRIKPVAGHFAGRITALGVSYPAPHGAHPLTGKRAADVPLAVTADDSGEQTPGPRSDRLVPPRLYEALRGGQFVLLAPALGTEAAARLRDAVAPWIDRVDVATPATATSPPTWLLVRPDAYVAWASNEPDPAAGTEALRAALASWCGAPTPAQAET